MSASGGPGCHGRIDRADDPALPPAVLVAVPDDALAEGWIELIGPNMPLDDVARACGTIGYEVLTGLGPRYARHYRHKEED